LDLEIPPPSSRLHPVIKATGWVSFFTDLGSEIIYPLLPEFVTGQLKASKKVFGLIEGMAEGVPAIVRYAAGALADRAKSRKGLILAGYALSSLVKPFIGLTKFASLALAPFLVLGLRVLDKLGKGIRGAPRDALVADLAGEARGRAFGYQRAMDHAGAMGGGLVAFLLLSALHVPIAWAIALSAIPGLLAVLTIVLFVHDPGAGARSAGDGGASAGDPSPTRVEAPSGGDGPGTSAPDLSAEAPAKAEAPPARQFQLYLVAAVLFALANSSDAFLLLRAKELGMAVAHAPLAWALLHVVKTATSYAGGALSDRIGRKPLLLGGWLLYAGVYASFAEASGESAAWALFGVYGLFFGLTEGVAKAFVADLVPQGGRGRAYGVLGMVEGLLLIPSSLAAGWLWDATGDGQVPLLLNAGFALAAAAWLAVAVRTPGRTSA
jgi:MFS family permease